MSLHVHIAPGDNDQEEVRKGSETMKGNDGTATCIASRPKHPIPISSHE